MSDMQNDRFPITIELGSFVAETTYRDVPLKVEKLIKAGILDCVGVILAGSREAPVRLMKQVFDDGGSEATLFPGTQMVSAPRAALINGTAAHVLDFDDVAVQGHISAVLLPALLAEAESLGCSGADLITAYFVGYETWAELVTRQREHIHRKGWHPTSVFGSIGAAAACASLRKLNPRQTSHALGIAASQSAGIVGNFGSMAKPFHAGRAAEAGLTSARLAEAGMTAAPDALEGPLGLLAAVSPSGKIDVTSPVSVGPRGHFERHGLTFKRFPTCLSTHRPIAAVLGLRNAGLDKTNVKSITVSMSRRNAEILHAHNPKTGLEAKFSLEFSVAAALIEGAVGLRQLADDTVLRPDIRDTMATVRVVLDDREDPATGYAPYDEVVVEMNSGETVTQRINATPGGPAAPLSHAEMLLKFDDCLEYSGLALDKDLLVHALSNLQGLGNVEELTASIRGNSEASTGTV